jgi:hypothetical protein
MDTAMNADPIARFVGRAAKIFVTQQLCESYGKGELIIWRFRFCLNGPAEAGGLPSPMTNPGGGRVEETEIQANCGKTP